MRWILLAILWAATGAGEVLSAAPCFAPPEPVTVRSWDGLTATLADGRELRLADVWTPDDPLLPTGRASALFAIGAPADRWGRAPGDVVFADTQGPLRRRLVAAGLAFVDPTVMSRECLETLLTDERSAEEAGRGLWPELSEAQLSAAEPVGDDRIGEFAFVVGTVASVGQTRRTIYLNFGDDYRTDFTVIVRRRDAERVLPDLTSLKGMPVRVRGVVEAWNGGLITARHPAQIERWASPSR